MNVIHLSQNILQHPLNRNAKMKTMRRFLNWQFASYIDSFLFLQKGTTCATGRTCKGLQEHAEMFFLPHFLKEGERIAYVGADIKRR